MKLCIFPNDPILSYYEKGEIKERYFNPGNFFDEIHIISFIENDVDESKVQILVGNAKLKIHSVGKINLKNKSKYKEKIINLVRTIKPDIIRAFNPLLAGWFAALCSKELGIPFFLSLHTQYDQNRNLIKKSNLKKYLALKYTEKFIEPIVLKNADKITIVYKIIEPYVKKHKGKKPELLYNSVDYDRFSNATPIKSLPKPLIISVGNLIKEKNHQCLIQAMKEIDAYCLIIGNGYMYDELIEMIKDYKLENKITIKKSIPHQEIQNYYKSATVFALAYNPELEGIPMPIMEAMASGLPVIIPFPKKEFSEGLENNVVFTERNPENFAKAIKKVLDDDGLRKELVQKSLEKAKEFDSVVLEKRGAEIYKEIITQNKIRA